MLENIENHPKVKFGRTGVPLYVLYPSEGEPIILPEILTEDILLRYLNELS